MNTNIDDYSTKELLELLDLGDNISNITESDVEDAVDPLISKFQKSDDSEMVTFLEDVKSKLTDDLNESDSDDDNSDTSSYNAQNDENTTIGNWYQNQYSSQDDSEQSSKTTDRKQKVDIYDDEEKNVMTQNRLGISNNYSVPVSQGTMNPTLTNITKRIINIDSSYRENIFPYTCNPDGVTSSTNYTVNLTDTIHNALNVKLYSYNIPNTWYLIDSNLGNNCFYVDSSAITIDDGNYTSEELIDEINTTLTSNNIDISFSYNTKTGKATLYTDIDASLIFYDSTGYYSCNTTCECSKNMKINNCLGWLLGYRDVTEYSLIYNLSMGSSYVSDSIVNTTGPKYFLLILDDYNRNHLNKGLVGISDNNKAVKLPSYWSNTLKTAEECTTINSKKTKSYVQNSPRQLSQAQLYTINQINKARIDTFKNRITSPTTTDVLAMIPINRSGSLTGDMYCDFGSSVLVNERNYFGPVDLERFKIRLVDDKGYTVNLNGNDWSFSLLVESLYQY